MTYEEMIGELLELRRHPMMPKIFEPKITAIIEYFAHGDYGYRPKGEWILEDVQRKEDVENSNYSFRCSECGYRDIHSKCVEVPFCWHCGAKMTKGGEDE